MGNTDQNKSNYQLRQRALTKSYENTITIPLSKHNRETIYDGIKKMGPSVANEFLDSRYESVTVRKMGKGIMKGGSLVLHEKDMEQKTDFSKTYPKLSGKISSAIYKLYENNSLIL